MKAFDLIAFTIGYEMSYTNILNMLELSCVPLLAREREGLENIVFAGGVCAVNPEPLADFIDFFSLGEGEEITKEIIDCYRQAKKDGCTKQEFLLRMSKIDGVYVPSFYEHTYNEDGALAAITPKNGAPARVRKRIMQDMDKSYFPTKTIVPSTEIVHDRTNLEIFRGCIRGCRFCQAGFCYRPVRAKSVDTLCQQAIESLEDSGNSEMTLASLSTSDYRKLPELADKLLDYCEPRKINLSLPSLRADNFSRDLMLRVQKVRKSGLTLRARGGLAAASRRDQQKRHGARNFRDLRHGVFRRLEQREALFYAGPSHRDGRGCGGDCRACQQDRLLLAAERDEQKAPAYPSTSRQPSLSRSPLRRSSGRSRPAPRNICGACICCKAA